jgi:hypothetical protein
MSYIQPYQKDAQLHSFPSSQYSTTYQPATQQQQQNQDDLVQQVQQVPQRNPQQLPPSQHPRGPQQSPPDSEQQHRIREQIAELWQFSPRLQNPRNLQFFCNLSQQELSGLEKALPLLRERINPTLQNSHAQSHPVLIARQPIPPERSGMHYIPGDTNTTLGHTPASSSHSRDTKRKRSDSTAASEDGNERDHNSTRMYKKQKSRSHHTRLSSSSEEESEQQKRMRLCPLTVHGDCKHRPFKKEGNLSRHMRIEHEKHIQGLTDWKSHLNDLKSDYWVRRPGHAGRPMTPYNTLLQTDGAHMGPTTPVRNIHFEMSKSPGMQTLSPNPDEHLTQADTVHFTPRYLGPNTTAAINPMAFLNPTNIMAFQPHNYGEYPLQNSNDMPHSSSDFGSTQENYGFPGPSN